MELKGTKIVEIPYFLKQIDPEDRILIVGECVAVDRISEGILKKGCQNVVTTDIRERPENGWLIKNTDWMHIRCDFLEFPDMQFDKIISVSVFEHFGLYWDEKPMHSNGLDVQWDHDIRGIIKAAKLLRDENSKLIITLPAGPFFNYNHRGYPVLRGYDFLRQNLIHERLQSEGFRVTDEVFYYSENFVDWNEADPEINKPEFYNIYNPFTPNVIWAFTVQI